MKAKYVRLFADDEGESHFEDLDAELVPTEFARASPPLDLSQLAAADEVGFLCGPAGWRADWHPSSARNLFVVISGEWEIDASDGETRRFGPGSVLLVEDMTGRGHKSHVTSAEESLAVVIRLT